MIEICLDPLPLPKFLAFSCFKPGHRAYNFFFPVCKYLHPPVISGPGADLYIWTKTAAVDLPLPSAVVNYLFHSPIQGDFHPDLFLAFSSDIFCHPGKDRIFTRISQGICQMVHLHISYFHINPLLSPSRKHTLRLSSSLLPFYPAPPRKSEG